MSFTLRSVAQQALRYHEGGGDVEYVGRVISDLLRAIRHLEDDAEQRNETKEWVNQHPIVRLYVVLLHQLNMMDGTVCISTEEYEKAVEEVKAIAEGQVVKS